ncbi:MULTISPECIES: CpsD/CapB family tyrosine-protein kinase [unclassified Sphingopyxis]|uniref:CpsD/CapB family tyrosine-protein kinase n=1 Tax=unclassified Sphingopyxis TaxID=2614943 RepID=UPI000A5BB710|nr:MULTISPECIES: CpsD/CapB family tyrosine-protein kinase [unclassified Sphingopyxis]
MVDANPPSPGDLVILKLADLASFTPAISEIKKHRIVGFDSRDARARPFNLLRTSFAKKLKEDGHRLVGITSATPAAGKSFLSMNLASSLARVIEEPVFLVDLDIRRASLAEEIGLVPERGIESFLEGDITDLTEIGHRIEGTNLGLFPAVRRTSNTAELLASDRFTQMIEVLRGRCEASTILFDLPPAFASDDAMISLSHLDGFILVVDAGKTTRRHVTDVLSMLSPTPCLGTILNRYSGGLGDSYGYGYGGPDYGKYYNLKDPAA